MAPVTSSSSDVLTELGDRPGANMTARLLLALTSLYVQRPTHTVEEQQQYIELALRLIDKVETETRAAVARILQQHQDAPAEVVKRLTPSLLPSPGRAGRSQTASAPLGSSPPCGGGSGVGVDDWGASAPKLPDRPPRPSPTREEGDEPAVRHAIALPGGGGGKGEGRDGGADGEAYSTRDRHSVGDKPVKSDAHLAEGDCASAPPSGAPAARQVAPVTSEFGEAFFEASPEQRRELLSLIARDCGDEVHAPTEDAERLYRRIDAAAQHRPIDELSCEFERLIDIPKRLCERILNDPSGEPLVVAAKAAGMPIAILQHILLVGPSVSHSVQRVYDLTELYHGLDGGAARDLLAQWRAQAKPDDPIPETGPKTRDREPSSSPYTAVASLRSRFSALTERVRSQALNAQRDRGNAVRRGPRSR